MFIRIVRKGSLEVSRTVLGLTAVCLLLLWYPAAVSTGISRGLSVCATVIIPTLYPFMLLAGMLTESPLCRRPGRLSGWIARRLFGLPGCCTPAILLSLTGGYPAGILAVARLYRQRQITRDDMKRMTAYCVGGGPGFIISTVGTMLLGSVQAGVWLYAAQVAATLVIGVLLGRRHRHGDTTAAPPPEAPPRPFARTVSDTCAALLTMCGFVVLGAMVLSLTEAAGIAAGIATTLRTPTAVVSALLAAVTEVSSGCIALVGVGGLTPLWLSLALSWGGLSVQGQLAAALPEERLIGSRFWMWRLIHGAISGGVAVLLFHLFPPDRATIGGAPTALPYSVSVSASAMLLLLTFLAMLCFSEKKAGKTE